MSAADFVRRFPELFHVTLRAALPGIAGHGLLPATNICTLHGLDPGAARDALERNRTAWHRVGDAAWLRWQNMPENGLANRLDPSLTTAEWRRLINGLVFFFPDRDSAERLRQFPRDRDQDQVVLRFSTAALVAAGCRLVTCRWNNGYLDRTAAARRRLRRPDDYRSIAEWQGGSRPREIASADPVPVALARVAVTKAGITHT